MENLTKYEQETVISFNREEKVACIFTYEKKWQRRLEGRMGLKPVKDNGYGGKEYVIDKKRIRMPMQKRLMSEDERKVRSEALAVIRSRVKNSDKGL